MALLSALLPNPHASVNSIFINSTVLSEEKSVSVPSRMQQRGVQPTFLRRMNIL